MGMKVIKRTNLPARLPLFETLIVITVMDYWNAPQWLWGVIGVLLFVVWICSLIMIFRQKGVDIFSDNN